MIPLSLGLPCFSAPARPDSLSFGRPDPLRTSATYAGGRRNDRRAEGREVERAGGRENTQKKERARRGHLSSRQRAICLGRPVPLTLLPVPALSDPFHARWPLASSGLSLYLDLWHCPLKGRHLAGRRFSFVTPLSARRSSARSAPPPSALPPHRAIITLTSVSDIRYVGRLHSIDHQESTISLENGPSFPPSAAGAWRRAAHLAADASLALLRPPRPPVSSRGTETRKPQDQFVPPSDRVYDFVVFRCVLVRHCREARKGGPTDG
jgi:hypothetical protein